MKHCEAEKTWKYQDSSDVFEMEMEQQASLDCGACLCPENVMFNEGNCVVTTSGPQKPGILWTSHL